MAFVAPHGCTYFGWQVRSEEDIEQFGGWQAQPFGRWGGGEVATAKIEDGRRYGHSVSRAAKDKVCTQTAVIVQLLTVVEGHVASGSEGVITSGEASASW